MKTYPAVILFDLDDTLISFEGVSEKAWEKCCTDFTCNSVFDFTKDQLLSVLKKTRTWYWSDPLRHKIGRENMINARREIIKLALAELCINDINLSNKFADQYSACQDDMVCLFPNTIETLTELKTCGIRMGLITNGSSEGQRAKLKRFGLIDFFEIILIDQEIGYGKPDPKIYKHALSLLNLLCNDVWMVGDNLIWDVQAPQSVGIYSVWNNYKRARLAKETDIIPDRIILDISELLIKE